MSPNINHDTWVILLTHFIDEIGFIKTRLSLARVTKLAEMFRGLTNDVQPNKGSQDFRFVDDLSFAVWSDVFKFAEIKGINFRFEISANNCRLCKIDGLLYFPPTLQMNITARIRDIVNIALSLVAFEEIVRILFFFFDDEFGTLTFLRPINDFNIITINTHQKQIFITQHRGPPGCMRPRRNCRCGEQMTISLNFIKVHHTVEILDFA